MSLVIDLVLAGFGIYLLVLSVRMQRSHKPSSVLVPEEQADKCKDVEKYVSCILPAAYFFAIVCILSGALGALADAEILSGRYWNLAALAVFIVGLGIFAWRLNKGRTLYF